MVGLFEYGKCAEDIIGAGRGECPFTDFGDLKGIGLIKKGSKITINNDPLNETIFRGLITDGKLHQLIEAYTFEDATPNNERNTSTDGLMQAVRAGKPLYNFTYKKGKAFSTAVRSLKGNGRWDAFLYFTEGVLLAMDTKRENLKGFDGGMFDPESYKFTQGTETEFFVATLQLTDADEFGDDWVFFSWKDLGYNGLKVDDAIQTLVSFNTAPLNLGTTIAVKLSDFYNRSISYVALFDTASNWKVTTDGVANVVTAVVIAGEVATLTLTNALATTDVVNVSLNGIVADDELRYYKSNTATATV